MLFKQVIGQNQVKEQLLKNVSQHRLSQAMLLLGPDGIGKLQLALAFVQYLMCENRSVSDSCGKCPSCLKNEKLIHPDVHYSFPIIGAKKDCDEFIVQYRNGVIENHYLSLNDWYQLLEIENQQGIIPVAESNRIIQKLSLKSYESKYKISILWNADKLRADATTKLLKIIEEPPPNTIFILISNNTEDLLPTLVSRTQIISVPLLSNNTIRESLINEGVSEYIAKNISSISSGSYRIAKELVNTEGSEHYIENFIEWMRLCFNAMKNTDKLLNWVEQIASTGRENQKVFLNTALEITRECILINTGTQNLLKIKDEELTKIKALAPFIHNNNLNSIIIELSKAFSYIGRNANPKILFLDLSMKMHQYLHTKTEELIA